MRFRPAALLLAIPLLVRAAGVTVVPVKGALPLDPEADAWSAAPAHKAMLSPQMITAPAGGGAVKEVEIRSVHNGSEIAFRLSWADSADDAMRAIHRFQDAAAVMFPSRGTDFRKASPFMGGPGAKVAIWMWRSDFAADLDGSQARRLAEVYPAYADFYNPAYAGTVAKHALTAQGARKPTQVEALVAEGFGTLARDSAESVLGAVQRKDGRRAVVLARSFAPAGREGAEFKPGVATGLNVAVWQGSADDRGARKSVGMAWIDLAWDGPAGP